jgi:hypothetical protein
VGRTIEIGPLVFCKIIRPAISINPRSVWEDVRFLFVRITSRDIVVPSSILYQHLFRNSSFTRQTTELMGIRNEVGPNISIGRYLSSTPFLFPLSHFPSSYREIKETYHLSKFLEITNILHRSILILKTSKRMISRLAISEEPPLLKELSGWSVLPSAPSSRITSDGRSYSLAHYQSHPSISI